MTVTTYRQTKMLVWPLGIGVMVGTAIVVSVNGGFVALGVIAFVLSVLVYVSRGLCWMTVDGDLLRMRGGFGAYTTENRRRGAVRLSNLTSVSSIYYFKGSPRLVGSSPFALVRWRSRLFVLEDASGAQQVIWSRGWTPQQDVISQLRSAVISSGSGCDARSAQLLRLQL